MCDILELTALYSLLLRLFLTLLTNVSASSLPVVSRKLLNNGFHRDLVTELDLSHELLDPSCNCHVILQETFPSALYVDPFQLRASAMFGGPRFQSSVVDVEQPEYRSSPLEVMFFRDLPQPYATGSVKFNLSVPVHARYHSVSSTTEQVEIFLLNPKLFLRCHNQTKANVPKTGSMGKEGDASPNCYKGQIIKSGHSFPCHSGSFQHDCAWERLQYKADPDGLHLSIPIGQKQHMVVVGTVTMGLTFVSVIYIVYTAFKVKVL